VSETKTYYMTKYALSTGNIVAFAGRVSSSGFIYDVRPSHSYTGLRLGKDVFETFDEALTHAVVVMLPKKVKSVEKQLGKLRAMKFELKAEGSLT